MNRRIALVIAGLASACTSDKDETSPTPVDSGSVIDSAVALDSSEDTGQDSASPDTYIADVADSDADTGSGSTLFAQPHPWSADVAAAPKSSESAPIISALAAAGGFAPKLGIDFSMHLLSTTASTPFATFTKTETFQDPDHDYVPFPMPAGGAVANETGYACTKMGDCHLLVVDGPGRKLYEMFRANQKDGILYGGSTVVWDLTKKYPDTLRGKGCVSADVSGMPIAPLLATADEVFAGEVRHALRGVLPGSRVQSSTYVSPATHATTTSGTADKIPFGARLRLKSSFDISGKLTAPGARVLATALQKYGMYVVEVGGSFVSAASDVYTTHKWSESGVNSASLESLTIEDFEVVEFGARTNFFGDPTCYRTP